MTPTNLEILEVIAALAKAQENYRATIHRVQDECDHKDVGEVEEFERDRPLNYRVCLACGKAEEWNCRPYSILKNSLVYKLAHEQARTLRKG